MFALDGRLLRTLPMLMLRPGRMTRQYIDGMRARFVPPFRLFLLTSVIFFLTVFTVLENQSWLREFRFSPSDAPSGSFVIGGDAQFSIGLDNDAEVAELRQRLASEDLSPEEPAQTEIALEIVEQSDSLAAFLRPDGSIDGIGCASRRSSQIRISRQLNSPPRRPPSTGWRTSTRTRSVSASG